MHGTSAGNPASLSTFGGLVTLASPDSLPEGASPRLNDVDFIVGQVACRAGLTSVYSYAGETAGPDAGSSAANVAITGNAWSNPSNILLNDGNYASCTPDTGSDALTVSGFAFNLPNTVSVTGFQVVLYGYSLSNVQVSVQLTVSGVARGAVKTITLPNISGPTTLGSLGDIWGGTFAYSDANSIGLIITASTLFPLATCFLDYVTIAVGQTIANANFNYITTFVAQNGDVKNLSLDQNGNLWVEDVTNNPFVLNLALEGITPGSKCTSVNGQDVEYLSFSDGVTGSDIPRQYTPNWIDRITQVGPGAAPQFTAITSTAATYAINTITQPAPGPFGGGYVFAFGLWSTGPGSTSPGNVVTQYYSDSTIAPQDNALVNAFNAGHPVYVFVQMINTVMATPIVVQVTSVGLGTPPGQARPFYYFTYNISLVGYTLSLGQAGYRLQYQQSLATMTTAVPVPGLTVGNQVTITGNSVPSYNNVWTISQTIDSGVFAITETQVTMGVATYTYALSSGVAPVVGQLVTTTGLTNANGALNLVNATIAGVAGSTFTINVSIPDYAVATEQGQATTAGTVFTFDPGFAVLGTSTSPIYGNGSGGSLTFAGNGQYIAVGTKQGTVFFITRNGYYTAPAPPVTFTVPENTASISATNIPIGPPNVIARGISFTESGANGVPGANFFYMDTPESYIVQNVSYTTTSTRVNDNTSTTAVFTFTDYILDRAQGIDIQGFDLFNNIEIGNPGWISRYDFRNVYGLCQNKIQNFVNMSFDGGYLPGGQLAPLGWSNPDIYGNLIDSPVFGNSYYIKNTTAGTAATMGLIGQAAYQDAYKQPIIFPNTLYSVRVTARIPSGLTVGSLVVQLVANGIVYGTYTLPFASMTTSMAIYSGTLLTTKFLTVPNGLTIQVFAQDIGAGADVEIDRIEPFDTAIPVLTTTEYWSYANDPEQVDAVTGAVQFISENQQPVNGGVVLYDTFYSLKASSMYSLQSVSNLEPSQWNEPEVAQKAGAAGILAFDFGEQWIVMACRNGVYVYEGGIPGKISQEIYQVWNAISWNWGNTIWVRNDVKNRRLFIGIPLVTPNFWMPDAVANDAPSSPNVMLMCNYQGCENGEELKSEKPLHVTMFGTLEAGDMRRKWSLWQIPSPYMGLVKTPTDEALYICNGNASSKVYRLDENAGTDDGADINWNYYTYGFTSPDKAATMPLVGVFRKLWGYMTMICSNLNRVNVTLYPNELYGPGAIPTGYNPWTVPGGFPPSNNLNDRECALNFQATRTYVRLSGTGPATISALTLEGKANPWNKKTGSKG